MARVKGGPATRTRRKKVLDLAKGYVGSKSKLFRVANEQILHSLKYAKRDRKAKKRDIRRLWIIRVNAAVREHGLTYSKFSNLYNKKELLLNKKMLAFLAVNYPKNFTQILNIVK